MSVINQMLQDLDKRQQSHALACAATDQISYPGRAQTNKGYWLLACGLSLALGGLAVYGVQHAGSSPDANTPQASPVENQRVVERGVERAAVREQAQSLTRPGTEAQALNRTQTQPQRTESTQAEPVQSPPASGAEPAFESSAALEASPAARGDRPGPVTEAVPVERVATGQESVSRSVQLRRARLEDAGERAGASAKGRMAVTEVKLTRVQLAQKRLSLATEAEQQGHLHEAATYYAEALALDPALHQARKQLAALHYGRGDLNEAAELLQQGRMLFPQEFEFTLLLARVQEAGGQGAAALVTLERLPDTGELARQKWLQQSELAQKLGQYAVAEQAYRLLLQREPQQGRWSMGLGYALDSQQQYSQAAEAYRYALAHPGLSTAAVAYVERRLAQLEGKP